MIGYLVRVFLTSGEHVDIGLSTEYEAAEKIFNQLHDGIKDGSSYTYIQRCKEKTIIKYESISAVEIASTEITQEDMNLQLRTWL